MESNTLKDKNQTINEHIATSQFNMNKLQTTLNKRCKGCTAIYDLKVTDMNPNRCSISYLWSSIIASKLQPIWSDMNCPCMECLVKVTCLCSCLVREDYYFAIVRLIGTHHGSYDSKGNYLSADVGLIETETKYRPRIIRYSSVVPKIGGTDKTSEHMEIQYTYQGVGGDTKQRTGLFKRFGDWIVKMIVIFIPSSW